VAGVHKVVIKYKGEEILNSQANVGGAPGAAAPPATPPPGKFHGAHFRVCVCVSCACRCVCVCGGLIDARVVLRAEKFLVRFPFTPLKKDGSPVNAKSPSEFVAKVRSPFTHNTRVFTAAHDTTRHDTR
jgi:hypothetical protein